MTTPAGVPDRREPWRYVVRGLVSLGGLVAIGYWALYSLVLAVLKCDDTCGRGENVEDWWWTGQFAIAVAGFVAGISALALGFSARRRPAYHLLLVVFLGILVTWVILVFIRPF